MPNYANGKIYCIRNRADGDKIVYVGSTTRPLSERMAEHRSTMNDVRRNGFKLYRLMSDVGIEHFHIELLTDFSCERRELLLQEEGRFIRLHDCFHNGCNGKISGQNKAESVHAYYVAHKEEISANAKVYSYANKTEIAAKKKAYSDNNKDAIKIAMRAHYEANKDRIKAQAKAYYDAHREERVAYRRAYVARKRAEKTVLHIVEEAPAA